MKKRIISSALILTLLLSLLPVGALAANADYGETRYAVEGGYIYFDLSTGTITDCDESVTKADIPAEINGVTVTTIGQKAFSGCSDLTSVTIPDSVTSIHRYAFWTCPSLTSIAIPNGVTNIELGAFSHCYSLTNITIPNGIASIEDYTFYCCTNLTDIVIPISVTSIGQSAFGGCTNLTDVVIPDSVTSIGELAFECCDSLTNVVIPNSVTSIGQSAFGGCTNLTDVVIPDGVKRIEYNTFFDCFNLTSVTIPDSVTSIGSEAFYNCYNLESVYFKGNAPELGTYVFDCYNSTTGENELPENLTLYYIEGKEGWTSPTWNGYRTAIWEDILYPVEGGNIYFDPATGTVTGCDESVTKADIPAAINGISVTAIGYRAFSECSKLTVVTIPNSVTSIGGEAFSFCGSLTDITIPASVKSIGGNAFYDCKSLAGITIPDGVKSIESCTFYGCSSLTSITIPDSVTSIDSAAFYGCNSLTSIAIPHGVTRIEQYTFRHCSGLTNVTIPDSVTSIGITAFMGCASLTNIVIPENVTSIEGGAFFSCGKLEGIYFKGDAPELGADVFVSIDSEEKNLTLYYIEGKKGWTSPTWNGYPTATWDGIHSVHTHIYENGVCTICGAALEFNDVAENAWYKDAVDYAVSNGLMNGMGDGKFEPETQMSRAMLVTVLWRYAGSPVEGENIFTDVPVSTWYTKAVAWAAKNDIVGGIGGGKFEPDGAMTREQLATVLYRYSKSLGLDVSKTADLAKFPDGNKVSSYATDALSWAVATGLIAGTEVNGKVYLDPQGSATRAQVATILMRFIENVIN